MHRLQRSILWIVSVFVFASISVMGQSFQEICEAVFENAFSELAQNCAGLETNQVCFGYGALTTEFVDLAGNPIASENAPLQAAGEQVSLYDAQSGAILRSIQTAPFNPQLDGTIDGIHVVQSGENLFRIAQLYGVDLEELTEFNGIVDRSAINIGQNIRILGIYDPDITDEEIQARIDAMTDWGLAAIYSGANYPAITPEAPATLLIFGDATVTDVTPLEHIFIPTATISVTADNAEIYIAPPNYPRPHTLIATQSGEFVADAISPDGQWLRVIYSYTGRFGEQSWAWIPSASVSVLPENLSNLAIFSPESASPMQRISVDINNRQLRCDGSSTSGVVVQTQDGFETDIVVNDVSIRLSSTIFIELLDSGGIRVTALEGVIQLEPDDSEDPIVLIPGFSVDFVYECPEGGDTSETGCTSETAGSQLVTQEPVVQDLSSLDTINTVTVSAQSAENVFNPVPQVTTVTSSGEGDPVTTIAISDPDAAAEIVALCQQGALPDYICQSVNE